MCTPFGLDCYKEVRRVNAEWLKPCAGLYADVVKDNDKSIPKLSNFASIYSSYESYKRGFHEDVNYRNVPMYFNPEESLLHWIRIYFSSPTFDKVTRDEKANLVTKISAIGGTMGLFAGFSIISGIELLYFGLKCLICVIVNNWRKKSKACKINFI